MKPRLLRGFLSLSAASLLVLSAALPGLSQVVVPEAPAVGSAPGLSGLAPLPAAFDAGLAPALALPAALGRLDLLRLTGLRPSEGPVAAAGLSAHAAGPGGRAARASRAEPASPAAALSAAAAEASGPGAGRDPEQRALWDGARPLNILMAASEAVPFAKTGGLADVVDALGRGLGRAGHNVSLVLPKYKDIRLNGHDVAEIGTVAVPLGDRTETARVFKTRSGGMDVYLLEHDGFFGREGIYSGSYGDHSDNDERFVFLSRAALEAARLVGFRPDVVHAHDWPTALLPALLKTVYADDPFFKGTASVLNVHNLAHQGLFPPEASRHAGVESLERGSYDGEGRLSFLRAGLVYADKLVAVSRNYARETRSSPEFGYGMEGLLAGRGEDYTGIVNGVDPELWDPRADPRLAARYGVEDAAEGKARNKEAFQRAHGLEVQPAAPLFGVVSRIAAQKGLDLVADILPALVKLGAQVVIVGSAHPEDGEGKAVEDRLRAVAEAHPDQVFVHPFDLELPNSVFAASDFYLMPSRFEPCGLSQQFAMLYGSIPVVTPVGGLADTVSDAERPEGGTGFHIREASARGVLAAVVRALAAYRRPETIRRIVTAAMGRDASWDASIHEYLEVYADALASVFSKSSGGSARSTSPAKPPSEKASSKA